ncbi:MAG: glycerol-3-phosphate dehydrogenase [Gemmatimonadales bacterium]|jgi:glycerol-3-phosphate dehydrogenase (NAD(P)+)|nr:glycerol-3-phosphate dehydrogenase [Gemmatimonadales bacterium]
MTLVAVLGAGSWGTTLANLLAAKGESVRLWAYEPEVVEAINRSHENPVFLPGVRLEAGLRAFADPREAVADAPVIVSAPPSHAVRSVVNQIRGVVRPGTLIVSATKGIETDTLALMSAVFEECLPEARFAALSGPSFAIEVCQGQPTLVVAAARDESTARDAQRIFATPRFRVYSHDDVVGVELAGALKNVIAIAAGILEGLGMGHNPRAALITRGLAEITRLGVALGANPQTFAGLAGMGDLILTTTGDLSRNRALGVALGQGQTLDDYRAAHRSVAEGANTSKAGAALGARTGVELPITQKVCEVLFSGKPAREGIAELMARELKSEQWR